MTEFADQIAKCESRKEVLALSRSHHASRLLCKWDYISCVCIPGHKAGRAPQPGVHGAMPPWIEAKKKAAGCTLRQNTAQIGIFS